MKNYTKIKIVFKDWSEKYIDEDEVVVYQLSGDYIYIAYQNDKGQLHRDGGLPAVEGAYGIKEWFENGKAYTKEEIEKKYNK